MKNKIFIALVIAVALFIVIASVKSQSNTIIELNSDGSWNWVVTPTERIITATSGPSQTPWIITATAATPTFTLTPFPTITPSPTPTLTFTPFPTLTEEPFLTATPTDEIGPVTLIPTATPTPSSVPSITPTATPDTGCLVQNQNSFGIRVRTLPVVRADTDTGGSIESYQYVHPEAVYYGNIWTWYKHWWDVETDIGVDSTYVWSAAELLTVISGCEALPYENPFPRQIRDGPHILMGEGASIVLNYAQNITAAKCLPGSFHLCQQLKAANPDIWIVARLFNDKALHDLDYDILEYWERYGHQIPEGFDAFEPENESTPQTEDQWRRWSSANIGLAKMLAQRGMQNMAFVFGPGWPEMHQVPYIEPYIKWVAENPLPDGRYHGIALHSAMYAPWDRPDMPWVNNEFLAGRIYMIDEQLETNLKTWPGVIAMTEIGLSDGYSGNWNATYSCNEVCSAKTATLDRWAIEGYPHVYFHWNIGKIGIWTSDHDCSFCLFG